MSTATPLRLVTLVGSLRQASYNRMVANTLPELAPAGVGISTLPALHDIPLYDGDVEAKGIPPAVTALAEAIRAADGLIIVTPEYNYSVPGVLKNAIDWLSRVPNQPFAGKPVLLQSASMGPFGGARAQYHLRQVLIYLNPRVFNVPEVMVGGVQNKVDAAAGKLNDASTRDHIAGQLARFADFIRAGA
ncbi:NADPH-dependent FMN reductase [Azospira oryzae]|jgi:chromate reductase, NAD(P)H dehydrogenase (quinone)|uniref:NADPH-dependent FMN reductase n=1 Tax=Azospira oryzae TaxID=146939 RepID=UPI0011FC8917|nr:NADPH-dependent FMN reductase [Azospira oryzae]TLS19086.1 MAG: NAD(P)H-dependent oxidoreductase [Betaproteobacteria bacterium]